MKKVKIYGVLLLLALGFSCSTEEKTVDDVIETTPRGAILRTINVISPAMDVLDPSAVWSVEVEEQDLEKGGLLKEVRLFASLVDNTPDATTNVPEALLETIPASAFAPGPFGLPRITLSSTLGEMASAIGISLGEYNCGDQFELRLELELTTGQVFTKGDTNPNIAGGQFFSSPFFYRANLIAPLSDDTLYTGQYQLTTIIPGIFGVADFQDGVVTIEATSNTNRIIRGLTTFPAFGGFGPVNFNFAFVCGEITVPSGQGMGAGCNGTIQTGSPTVNATYDISNPDDSEFIINFTSDEGGDCVAPVQAAIRLTKL